MAVGGCARALSREMILGQAWRPVRDRLPWARCVLRCEDWPVVNGLGVINFSICWPGPRHCGVSDAGANHEHNTWASRSMLMRELRIHGVVALAVRVRRELARPVTAAGRAALRQLVTENLAQVQRIIVRHGATIEHLPGPTRRAYDFLAGLNFDGIGMTTAGADEVASPAGVVRLVGLQSFWERLLDQLARASTPLEFTKLHGSIAKASDNLTRYVHAQDLALTELTPRSREICGWLAYFQVPENFAAYTAAVGRVRPAFDTALRREARFRPPALVQFRSLPGLYRIRGYANATRIALATPTICFSEELFRELADVILMGASRRRIQDVAGAEEYQSIQAELDALAGLPEQPTGLHHDLAVAFERVNGQYFDGSLARPRLTWSRTFTGRKFGHYDPVRDTVMLSCSLDRADVPAFVVDFVLYHELLHKQLGVDWRNGRAAAHTPEFRAAERRFAQHAEAERILQQLGRGGNLPAPNAP